MQKFTVSEFINPSQQEAFDFISNARNFERWMPLMQSAHGHLALSLVSVQLEE